MYPQQGAPPPVAPQATPPPVGGQPQYADPNQQQMGAPQGQPTGETQQLNPAVKFYKPRRNFNPQDPKTHGSALQIDLAIRKADPAQNRKATACCFLNMATQNAPTGQGGVFNWKGKMSFKLGRPDICKLLTVHNILAGGVELVHKSGNQQQGERTTFLSYNMVQYMTDQSKHGWFIQQLQEGKISPYAVQARLYQQPSNIAMSVILQPEEVVEIGEFLKFSLWRIFNAER